MNWPLNEKYSANPNNPFPPQGDTPPPDAPRRRGTYKKMITQEQAAKLLEFADIDAADAIDELQDAMQKLTTAQAQQHEERSMENGETVYVPIKRLAAELLDNADVPDSAMPGGRGGTADERKKARENWCMKNSTVYREYVQQLEDAEFRETLAQGAVKVAERKTARADSKFMAVKAMFDYLTAQVNAETMRERTRAARIERGLAA